VTPSGLGIAITRARLVSISTSAAWRSDSSIFPVRSYSMYGACHACRTSTCPPGAVNSSARCSAIHAIGEKSVPTTTWRYPPAGTSPRATRTHDEASRTVFSATEPRSTRRIPLRPCVPTTRRSAPSSRAASASAGSALPSATTCDTVMPWPDSRSRISPRDLRSSASRSRNSAAYGSSGLTLCGSGMLATWTSVSGAPFSRAAIIAWSTARCDSGEKSTPTAMFVYVMHRCIASGAPAPRISRASSAPHTSTSPPRWSRRGAASGRRPR
jgi:hypothetical protein